MSEAEVVKGGDPVFESSGQGPCFRSRRGGSVECTYMHPDNVTVQFSLVVTVLHTSIKLLLEIQPNLQETSKSTPWINFFYNTLKIGTFTKKVESFDCFRQQLKMVLFSIISTFSWLEVLLAMHSINWNWCWQWHTASHNQRDLAHRKPTHLA